MRKQRNTIERHGGRTKAYAFLLVCLFFGFVGFIFFFTGQADAAQYCVTKNGKRECEKGLVNWNVREKYKNATRGYWAPEDNGGKSKSSIWYDSDHREGSYKGICNGLTCITGFQPKIDNFVLKGPIKCNVSGAPDCAAGFYYELTFDLLGGNLKKITSSSSPFINYIRVGNDNKYGNKDGNEINSEYFFWGSYPDMCFWGYHTPAKEKESFMETQFPDGRGYRYQLRFAVVAKSVSTTFDDFINCGIIAESNEGFKIQKNFLLKKLPLEDFIPLPDPTFFIGSSWDNDRNTTTVTVDNLDGVRLGFYAGTAALKSSTIDGVPIRVPAPTESDPWREIEATNVVSGAVYVAPKQTTTYTYRVKDTLNREVTRQVTVKVNPLSLNCGDVTLAESGKNLITVTWRAQSADKVSVECATTWFRSCPKRYFQPGEAAVLSNVDTGDTVVTVIAHQGNQSTPPCSQKIAVSKEVDIIEVVVHGIGMGNRLLDRSLIELITGSDCPKDFIFGTICGALSFNNIWRTISPIVTKALPGLGDLVGMMFNFLKGPVMAIFGVIANVVDNFVIHKNTPKNLLVSIQKFLGGFVKEFIPHFIAGAAEGVFNRLFGNCLGSKVGGLVNVGVQALYGAFGGFLQFLGGIPGLGLASVGDIGTNMVTPCEANNSGCTAGICVGNDTGKEIGKTVLGDVIAGLFPGAGAAAEGLLDSANKVLEPIGMSLFPECRGTAPKADENPIEEYICKNTGCEKGKTTPSICGVGGGTNVIPYQTFPTEAACRAVCNISTETPTPSKPYVRCNDPKTLKCDEATDSEVANDTMKYKNNPAEKFACDLTCKEEPPVDKVFHKCTQPETDVCNEVPESQAADEKGIKYEGQIGKISCDSLCNPAPKCMARTFERCGNGTKGNCGRTEVGCGCPLNTKNLADYSKDPVKYKSWGRRAVANALMSATYVFWGGDKCVPRKYAYKCAAALDNNAPEVFKAIFGISKTYNGDLRSQVNKIKPDTFINNIYNVAIKAIGGGGVACLYNIVPNLKSCACEASSENCDAIPKTGEREQECLGDGY